MENILRQSGFIMTQQNVTSGSNFECTGGKNDRWQWPSGHSAICYTIVNFTFVLLSFKVIALGDFVSGCNLGSLQSIVHTLTDYICTDSSSSISLRKMGSKMWQQYSMARISRARIKFSFSKSAYVTQASGVWGHAIQGKPLSFWILFEQKPQMQPPVK